MVTPGVANFWKGESNRGKETAPTAQDDHPSCRLHTRIAVCECYSLTRDPSNGNSWLPTGFSLAWRRSSVRDLLRTCGVARREARGARPQRWIHLQTAP